MRSLIINADDFGMSQEVNDGIKQGIKAGIINSVSLMVNMPYFNDAVEFLKKNNKIAIGLHFNVTEGAPLSQPKIIQTLLREDNNFYYWINLSIKLLTKQCSLEEIEHEFELQYNKLKKTGLLISHIDSHHHIHLYPSIYKRIFSLVNKKHIRSLRTRRFHFWNIIKSFSRKPSTKQVIFSFLCLFNFFQYVGKKNQLLNVDKVYDMGWNLNITNEKFLKYIEELPDGLTEIICHPAVISKTGNLKFLKPRQQILDILLDEKLKRCLAKNNIKLFVRNGA